MLKRKKKYYKKLYLDKILFIIYMDKKIKIKHYKIGEGGNYDWKMEFYLKTYIILIMYHLR